MTASLEYYTMLSLRKKLVDSGIISPVLTPGYRGAASQSEDDWAAIDIVSIVRRPARRGSWKGEVIFQVSLFSRTAEYRSDGKSLDIWNIASLIRAEFETEFSITKIGAGGAYAGTLSVGEGDLLPLPERRLGDAPEGVHGVVVSFNGMMTAA